MRTACEPHNILSIHHQNNNDLSLANYQPQSTMHFSTIFAPLLLATALALPSHPSPRHDQTVNNGHSAYFNYVATIDGTTVTAEELSQFSELAAAYEFAAAASGCNKWKCASVLLKVPCIIKAIKKKDWGGVGSCIGKDKVSCAFLGRSVG